MGCGKSHGRVYDHRHLVKWKPQFELLFLSKYDVGRLFEVFRTIDMNDSGTIGLTEMLVHLDLDKTQFIERVFLLFDDNGSGAVDFCEFVVSVWNYCTLGPASLTTFTFDLYDSDGSGVLSVEEVDQILLDNYGANFDTNFHAKQISKSLHKISQNFDYETFLKFSKSHKALLFPAFHIQSVLTRKILGSRFWSEQAAKRAKVSKGKYIPVVRFLDKVLKKKKNKEMLVRRYDSDEDGEDHRDGEDRKPPKKTKSQMFKEVELKLSKEFQKEFSRGHDDVISSSHQHTALSTQKKERPLSNSSQGSWKNSSVVPMDDDTPQNHNKKKKKNQHHDNNDHTEHDDDSSYSSSASDYTDETNDNNKYNKKNKSKRKKDKGKQKSNKKLPNESPPVIIIKSKMNKSQNNQTIYDDNIHTKKGKASTRRKTYN
eukprot:gene9777-13152_t